MLNVYLLKGDRRFMTLKTPAQIGLTVLAGIALAVGLAYLNRWQLAIFSFIPLLAVLVSLVLALLGLVLRRRAKAHGSRRLHSFGHILLLLSLVLGLQLVALPAAQMLRDLEIKRTQAFLASLIPKLEDYKRQHIDYPENLAPLLPPGAAVPALLQLTGPLPRAYDNRNFYQRQDTTYSFEFYVPDGFIGFEYHYCCGTEGIWTVTD